MRFLREILKEITDWQDSVFTKATPKSAAAHLRREVDELLAAIELGFPKDIEGEIADCFFLIAGVAHLSGIDLESVVDQKMIINRRRIWGEPDQDGVVEHVREAAEKANSLLEDFNKATDYQFEEWQNKNSFGQGDMGVG